MDFLKSQFTLPVIVSSLMWGAIWSSICWVWGYFGGWTPKKRKWVFYIVVVPLTFTVLRWTFDFAASGKDRPKFNCGMDYAVICERADETGNILGSVVGGSVWIVNVGAPSVVKDWSGYLVLPKGQKYDCVVLPGVPTKSLLEQLSSNPVFTIDAEKSIIVRSAETPIPYGGGVNGMIFLYLNGVKQEFVKQEGNKLAIVFHDDFGKEYTATYPIGAGFLFPMK